VQGFQLVFDGKDTSESKVTSSLRWSGQNGSHIKKNIFALHQALAEQKALLMRKNTNKRGKEMRGRSSDVCVKLSLGKVFQELKLVYPHIHVTVYKQKVQYNPKPFIYSYNLCRAWPTLLNDYASSELRRDRMSSRKASPLRNMQATFSYKRTEDYNWNYLDQHVCGYSDFEVLQEVSDTVQYSTVYTWMVLETILMLVEVHCRIGKNIGFSPCISNRIIS